MRWTPVSGREEMGPGDPWRRVVQGAPSPFFDYWAPPIAPRTTLTAAFIHCYQFTENNTTLELVHKTQARREP